MGKRPGHKRLKPGEEDFRYDVQTILAKPVHMDARRVLDRYLRYERVLQVKSDWKPLDFDGKRILEIGCGPLLGIGPIATYLGATDYVCVEPRFHQEVLESNEVRTCFFLPLYHQLDALYARGLSFDEFIDRIKTGIRIDTIKIEDYQHIGNPMDIVYSNGVLNHICDIDSALNRIHQVSHESTQQYHVVNFTDHNGNPPDDPFREIYSQEPAQYFEHDSLLNLKRPSEILQLFSAAGITLSMVPYIVDEAVLPDEISPYWTRFDASELAVQIAFFVN